MGNGGKRMTQPLDIMQQKTSGSDWITRRLAAGNQGGAGGGLRGDHDLNPGTRPETPLTPAAVLVPLVDHGPDTAMTVLLTRRTETLEHHAGQISFPGGHMEPGESAEGAALRETEEETGLEREAIELLGLLDIYETRTGFRVTPVVGRVRPPLILSPDPVEVDEVFEVPLDFFLDPVNHQRHMRTFEGRERAYYAMPYGDYFIWGATAGMLFNLYERLKDD